MPCGSHSKIDISVFYFSIYLTALGNGGYEPNITTFGADQFDREDHKEGQFKATFFSYYYLSLNLGSLFSNIVLSFFEDKGMWAFGFWVSAGSAVAALLLFLAGTPRYRHFQPSGNIFTRVFQVLVSAATKWRIRVPPIGEGFFHNHGMQSPTISYGKILDTHEFTFLDKAAYISSRDLSDEEQGVNNPWRICPITHVEEVKCILRLMPINLCTIIYSVVYTQMASLFVEQGAAMKTTISNFHIPPASISSFNILSVALFIFLDHRVLDPFVGRLKKSRSKGLTELQRMGVGLIIAAMAMVTAGIVERYRLKYAVAGCSTCKGSSSLSILWQVPQYALIGASEVFMYVGQLEFLNAEAPDGLKSFGSALCMTSVALGNYVSSLLVTMVMKISTKDHMPGWIPSNLNKGHLDRFYFLLAALTFIDFGIYIACAKLYKPINLEDKCDQIQELDSF